MWDFSISASSCWSSQKTNDLLFGDRGLLQKEYVRTSVRPDFWIESPSRQDGGAGWAVLCPKPGCPEAAEALPPGGSAGTRADLQFT